MRFLFVLILFIASVGAGRAFAAGEWKSTTLSQATIEKVNQATLAYHRCLSHEIEEFRYTGQDSRAETDRMLKDCEPELMPIRKAFDAEHVLPQISDRYLRRKRNQAARRLVQIIMAAEAAHRVQQN